MLRKPSFWVKMSVVGMVAFALAMATAPGQAARGGYFSPGVLSTEPGVVVGGGSFRSVGPVVVGVEGFGFAVPDNPGGMGLVFAAYPVRPRETLLVLPAVGLGGGGRDETGGLFASLGLRMLYFPSPDGYALGVGVDYLFNVAGEPPRGLMVRVALGGGSR